MAKYDWKPIEEMDLEDGTHTCFSVRIGNSFWYCTQISDDTWDVEECRVGSDYYTTHVNCKTLTSAKRWVSRNVYDPDATAQARAKRAAALEKKVSELLTGDLANKARAARKKANEHAGDSYNSGYLNGYAEALREAAGMRCCAISDKENTHIWMLLTADEILTLNVAGYSTIF